MSTSHPSGAQLSAGLRLARQVLRHRDHPGGHAARGAPGPHRPRQHQVRDPFLVQIYGSERSSGCLSVRPAVILLNSSPNLHHSGSDLQAFFAALSALIAFSEYFVKLSEHKLLRLVSDHIFFRRVRNRSVNAYVYRVFSKQRYYNKYSKKVKRRRHVSRMTRRRRHSR